MELEVVLEHDRLAVEVEVGVAIACAKHLEHAVHELDEAKAELFAGEMPLAIPVSM